MLCNNDCPHYIQCDLEGHKAIGWCLHYGMFVLEGQDEDCWEWPRSKSQAFDLGWV